MALKKGIDIVLLYRLLEKQSEENAKNRDISNRTYTWNVAKYRCN